MDSLTQIKEALNSKKISQKELLESFFTNIKAKDQDLGSFISLNEKILEEKIRPGLLSGIPIGIKDLFCTKDLKTTAGSRILENWTSPYTATAVKKLEREGAFVIGKCNLDEFGMGSTGENSYFKVVKNPWGKDRSAGGSSSGSAVAVSAGFCPASLGTDTGGSVRLPAHYCGIVGVKPSYGRVSRYGMIAYASSLDQAGVFTKTVEDASLILDVISGEDDKDATTVDKETFFQKNLNPDIKGKTVLYLDLSNLKIKLDPCVIKAQEEVLKVLKKKGCKLKPCKLPYEELAIPIYYLISTAEASSNLSRYDGLRYGYQSEKKASSLYEFYSRNRTEAFGKEVKRRILMGTFCLSTGFYDEFYFKACQIRGLIKKAFDEFFKEGDVFLSPTAVSPAPPLFEKQDPLEIYFNDQFTVFANLIGAPAMSLPWSLSKEGLPVGIQLMAQNFEEQKMFNVAYSLEKEIGQFKKPEGF